MPAIARPLIDSPQLVFQIPNKTTVPSLKGPIKTDAGSVVKDQEATVKDLNRQIVDLEKELVELTERLDGAQ